MRSANAYGVRFTSGPETTRHDLGMSKHDGIWKVARVPDVSQLNTVRLVELPVVLRHRVPRPRTLRMPRHAEGARRHLSPWESPATIMR